MAAGLRRPPGLFFNASALRTLGKGRFFRKTGEDEKQWKNIMT